MSPTNALPLLQLLVQQLEAAKHRNEQAKARNIQGSAIQVSGTGKALLSAYEQLRNAAEYTEEHLLLQRAIRRFFNRNLSFFIERHIGNIGEELVVELTQAGYIRNSTLSTETANAIVQLSQYYMDAYWKMREAHVSRDEATEWVLAILSVEVEEMINPHAQLEAIAQFGYQHYLQLLPREKLLRNKQDDASQYEISLYIAAHMALLKSDVSIIRHDLLRMYQQTPDNLEGFVRFNRLVTKLYTSALTQRLKHAVSRYGAPVRILKTMIDDGADIPYLLQDREAFLGAYRQQIQKEYRSVKRRLNQGLIKSIIFIFITKIIIGIGIEVPYDLIFHDHVILIPLIINLLVPPLYMASLKLGIKVPTGSNADALTAYIDKALFSQEQPVNTTMRDVNKPVRLFSKLLYSLLFLIPFGITVYVLLLLGFNVVQGVIFFTFLSTASFLGFRLSRMVRELEIVTKQTGFFASVRDFFYLPFILVGQWLSSKYAKVNAVAYVLDIAIEMPLKTVLRLVRQWTRFLNEKQDEIY